MIRWIGTGWILSGWWAMQGDFKSPVAVYQTTICERCTEEHNRLNFKGWITTDSIQIFPITLCTPVTILILHLQNSERRFQNCALRYNFLVTALRCSPFRFKTVIFLRLYLLCSWHVQRCMLDSVFVLWFNSRDGLKLVSKMALKKWKTNFRLKYSIWENRTTLKDVPLLPEWPI